MLKDEPAEIHLAASRLFAGRNHATRGHRRAWRHEPDSAQRHTAQPVSSVEASGREDQGHLVGGDPQRLLCESARDIERRVADDVVVALAGHRQEIERGPRTVPAAINQIGAVSDMTRLESFLDDGAEAAARVPYRPDKPFLLEKPRAAPGGLNVVFVGLARPGVSGDRLGNQRSPHPRHGAASGGVTRKSLG